MPGPVPSHPSPTSRRARAPAPVAAALLLAAALLAWGQGAPEPSSAPPPATPGDAVARALTLLAAPRRVTADWEYEMTGRVRLLVFWVSKAGVGGGHVRFASTAGGDEIEVVFGSDPKRAPRRINRWGAGREVRASGDDAPRTAFFGFMKTSEGKSVADMEAELGNEQSQGGHRFAATVNMVEPERATAAKVHFLSERDFDMSELERAAPAVLERLETLSPPERVLGGGAPPPCRRVAGFLGSVKELVDHAMAGGVAPRSLCYTFNARRYTLTLERLAPVKVKTVRFAAGAGRPEREWAYHDLVEARFRVLNHDSGAKSSFQLTLGTTGALRGIPVEIRHRPTFWFDVILQLYPPDDPAGTPDAPRQAMGCCKAGTESARPGGTVRAAARGFCNTHLLLGAGHVQRSVQLRQPPDLTPTSEGAPMACCLSSTRRTASTGFLVDAVRRVGEAPGRPVNSW